MYFDAEAATTWMLCNGMSLAVDLMLNQPATIMATTVVSVAFGPLVSRALVERAGAVIPGV